MRRQGMSFGGIAKALGKTQRAVEQKHLKIVPVAAGSPGKSKFSDIEMSEEMEVKLLGAVAKMKTGFWVTVAKEVGGGASGPQCEAKWNDVVRNRN